MSKPAPLLLEDDFEKEESPPTPSDCSLAMAAHLGGFFTSFLVPLILWHNARHSHVIRHAAESLNYQISLFLQASLLNLPALIVAVVAAYVFGAPATLAILLGCGVLLLLAFFLAMIEIVLVVIACRRALRGAPFRYPLTIRFF